MNLVLCFYCTYLEKKVTELILAATKKQQISYPETMEVLLFTKYTEINVLGMSLENKTKSRV